MDNIDRKILRELQNDARIQNNDLAERVGLSPSPCLRRVRILEKAGVIAKYAAILSANKLGLPLTIFVKVTLNRQSKGGVDTFAEAVSKLELVQECYLMTGNYDFLLRVVAADFEHYQRFLDQHLTQMDSVQNIITEVPMKPIKTSSILPTRNIL